MDDETRRLVIQTVRSATHLERNGKTVTLPLPRALRRADLPLVHQPGEYVVSFKADGERGLLVMCMTELNVPIACIYYRSERIEMIDPTFVVQFAQTALFLFSGTVIDAEVVQDRDNPDRKIILAFDMYQCVYRDTKIRSYPQRLTMISKVVHIFDSMRDDVGTRVEGAFAPHPKQYKMDPSMPSITATITDKLAISVKPVFTIDVAHDLLAREWRCKTDGLVYTPVRSIPSDTVHSSAGEVKPVLKYKILHTVDFLLLALPPHVSEQRRATTDPFAALRGEIGLYARSGNEHVLFASIAPYEEHEMNIDEVWEFCFDGVRGWVPMFRRIDKTEPNAVLTAQDTVECIRESVRPEELWPHPPG